MNASKFFLKAANSLVTAIVALFLILAAAYSGYALWDNAQVYGAVDDIQSQLLKLKPDPEQKDGGASFEELRKINPDVCGWITLDHTKIDYPILQGEDNLTYINTDVYGDFALSGSIFLDSGCDRNFQGKYSLLYGHHMAEHKMFGDLDLYRKKKFFDKNTTGTLILPDRSTSWKSLHVCRFPHLRILFLQRENGRRTPADLWILSEKTRNMSISRRWTTLESPKIFPRYWQCQPALRNLQMQEQFFWR